MTQFIMLFVTIALTVAITVVWSPTTTATTVTATFAREDAFKDLTSQGAVNIRRSRFLAEKGDRGQGPKDHCHKDPKICTGENSSMACCNNKCIDLSTNDKNCGACNNKCKFGQTCCSGQCVNLNFNKGHCGECNHLCQPRGYCNYGLCDYAS